jgi:hypothetical protein
MDLPTLSAMKLRRRWGTCFCADANALALPGEEFVAGGRGEKGNWSGAGVDGAVEALDGLGTGGSGPLQSLFGLAQDDDRRAAMAGGDAKTG